jgi:uncharacterized protein (DUF302 family)
MPPAVNEGIVDKPSNQSVDQTVEKLKSILQAKGVMLFALVDHSGEAEKVGMKMHPTKLLIFGSPKAGTPLMQAAPTIAIDLPLKILVWEDADGKTWVSYNSPAYLQQRHGLPRNCCRILRWLTRSRARPRNDRICRVDSRERSGCELASATSSEPI